MIAAGLAAHALAPAQSALAWTLAAMAVPFAFALLRRWQQRRSARLDADNERIRRLKTEAMLLRGGAVPSRHPMLLAQMRIFERAVSEAIAAISRSGVDRKALAHLEYLVHRTAPDVLAPLMQTEHREAVVRACREFQRLSLHLVSTYIEVPTQAGPRANALAARR